MVGSYCALSDGLVRLERDDDRLGEDLAGLGLGVLEQRARLEGGLREVAHVLVLLGQLGEDGGGLDLGRRHGGVDRPERLVDGRGAVPDRLEVRRVERVEEEVRVLAVVGQVRVALR